MGIIVGLCLAAIAGFFVGQDANKRGMNGAGWGIATFLLCIFSLPLYLIVRKPLEYPSYQAGKPRLCRACGKYYQGQAAFCPLCGVSQPV